jgi:hypothetical protein
LNETFTELIARRNEEMLSTVYEATSNPCPCGVVNPATGMIGVGHCRESVSGCTCRGGRFRCGRCRGFGRVLLSADDKSLPMRVAEAFKAYGWSVQMTEYASTKTSTFYAAKGAAHVYAEAKDMLDATWTAIAQLLEII